MPSEASMLASLCHLDGPAKRRGHARKAICTKGSEFFSKSRNRNKKPFVYLSQPPNKLSDGGMTVKIKSLAPLMAALLATALLPGCVVDGIASVSLPSRGSYSSDTVIVDDGYSDVTYADSYGS